MKLILILAFAVLAAPSGLPAQHKDHPEVRKFSSNIKDIIWDLRGTNRLKHLRFDGESIEALRDDGKPVGKYDHAFVDPGVFRLDFKGPTSGWYFISDDSKYITAITASFEFAFKAAKGSPMKRVRSFPEDIKGVVWEGQRDGRQFTLQWDGAALEVSVKDRDVKRDKLTPVIANRRVFESVAENDSLIWFVFSEDGSEGWLLQIVDIFGGHAHAVPRRASLSPEETGLPSQLNDLANHAEDLLHAGDKMRTETLVRFLSRKVAQQTGTAGNSPAQQKLSKRFGPAR